MTSIFCAFTLLFIHPEVESIHLNIISSLTWRHCRADESHIMLHSYATEQHDFCSLNLFFFLQRHCILLYRKRMLQTSAAIKYIFNPSSISSRLAWSSVVSPHWQACLLGMSSSAPVMGKRAKEVSQKGRQRVSESYTERKSLVSHY